MSTADGEIIATIRVSRARSLSGKLWDHQSGLAGADKPAGANDGPCQLDTRQTLVHTCAVLREPSPILLKHPQVLHLLRSYHNTALELSSRSTLEGLVTRDPTLGVQLNPSGAPGGL